MLTMWSLEGGMGIALEEPKACVECKAMHYFFVNRDGRTRCAGCDAKAQKLAETNFGVLGEEVRCAQ